MTNNFNDDRVSISYVIDRLDGLVSQDNASLSDISSFVEFRNELVFNLGQNALAQSRTNQAPDFVGVEMDEKFGPFDIYGRIRWVAQDCIRSALLETNDNRSKAARLLGMPSLQTFTNWLKKYEVDA